MSGAVYKVGDPDPWPDMLSEPFCWDTFDGFSCTRPLSEHGPEGSPGDHVAVGGCHIAAVWPVDANHPIVKPEQEEE